jgi:hypothetical protein
MFCKKTNWNNYLPLVLIYLPANFLICFMTVLKISVMQRRLSI